MLIQNPIIPFTNFTMKYYNTVSTVYTHTVFTQKTSVYYIVALLKTPRSPGERRPAALQRSFLEWRKLSLQQLMKVGEN